MSMPIDKKDDYTKVLVERIEELEARLRRSNDDYEEMRRSVLEECGYDPDEPGLDVLPDEAATNVREALDRLREVVREQAEACERMAWECRMGITDGEPSLHEVEAALRAALEEE